MLGRTASRLARASCLLTLLIPVAARADGYRLAKREVETRLTVIDRALAAAESWRPPFAEGRAWPVHKVNVLRESKLAALLALRSAKDNIERSRGDVDAWVVLTPALGGWHPLRVRWLDGVTGRLDQRMGRLERIRERMRRTSSIWDRVKDESGVDADWMRATEAVLSDDPEHDKAMNAYLDSYLISTYGTRRMSDPVEPEKGGYKIP
jgi:hypothetical protein